MIQSFLKDIGKCKIFAHTLKKKAQKCTAQTDWERFRRWNREGWVNDLINKQKLFAVSWLTSPEGLIHRETARGLWGREHHSWWSASTLKHSHSVRHSFGCQRNTSPSDFMVFGNRKILFMTLGKCCSVTQSCLTLWPHRWQHTRPPCPSPSPWVCSNSCPLNRWCHPTIPSFCLPASPPAFYLTQHQDLFQWLSTSVTKERVSASASVLPINIQDWFPLGLTGWISLQSKGLSRVFPNTTVQKHQFFSVQLSL